MTQGRNAPGDRDEGRTLFDGSKGHFGLTAEQTPPPVPPRPGSPAPEPSPITPNPTIVAPTPLTISGPSTGTPEATKPEEVTGVLHTDNPSGLGYPIAFEGSAPLAPGQVLFDRYIVERQLGEGGMGTVWLVRRKDFEEWKRALKLIVSGIANDQQARARFRREAKIMERLNHPNAVRVYDAGLGNDVAFIEMEYVQGQSLNQLMAPGKPMPLEWVADLLDQLCGVLQAANDEGITHRDLKPPNLMLVERPHARSYS